MLFITSAYAQSAPAPAGATSGFMSILPLILMFVVLYFIMIRPQMKKQKETKALLAALQVGNEVATTSGMLGKIVAINDAYIILRIAPEVDVSMQRSAVLAVFQNDTLKDALPKIPK